MNEFEGNLEGAITCCLNKTSAHSNITRIAFSEDIAAGWFYNWFLFDVSIKCV
jgi:hypothetical protein